MKTKILLTSLFLSINSFGTTETKPIPEAGKLHSDLHTIQFTLAELSEDFQIGYEWPTNAPLVNLDKQEMLPAEIIYLSSESKPVKSSPLVERIIKSNPTYTNLATVYITPDEAFSEKKGGIKGIFNSKSQSLDIFQITVPGYGIIKTVTFDARPGKWHVLILGGKIIDGKEKKYAILIKCYEPEK